MMLSASLSQLPSLLALTLLALSTLSTKAAGLFWLVFILIGATHLLWSHRSQTSTTLPNLATTLPNPLHSIAKGWLLVCVFALVCKSIPHFYWSAPWPERHPEFRLLLGALGTYWLLRQQRWPHGWHTGIGHGLALACVFALGLAAIIGSNAAPTNRIPWAAGLSLLSCLLLSWSFMPAHTQRQSLAWRYCSLLGLTAVMISGVRGSYLLAVIWPALWLGLTWQTRALNPRLKPIHLVLQMVLAVSTVTLITAWAPAAESPIERAQLVVQETGHAEPHKPFDPNSSNGARILLWQAGLNAFLQHWLLGLGFDGAKHLIQQTAYAYQSDTLFALGHFHSDYIHTATEFGIFGLISFLALGAGMAWMAWRLHGSGHSSTALGMLALLLMNLSTALSNMNFAHNYYPTILSISIGLLLLSAQPLSSPRQPIHN
jgi:O-antigen ligase